MIITELTPNPDSLKFLSEKVISTIGTEEFQKKDFNKIENEFVKNLLNLKGVELVLLADTFLSVKKNKEISWDVLKPTVISHMNDYFEKNDKPILNKKKKINEDQLDLGEIENRIIKVLDEKVRPAVAKDGGDIKFRSYPSSLMTLKQGVQNLLCHYVEEVKSVEAI